MFFRYGLIFFLLRFLISQMADNSLKEVSTLACPKRIEFDANQNLDIDAKRHGGDQGIGRGYSVAQQTGMK
jgi:hypothetical protein